MQICECREGLAKKLEGLGLTDCPVLILVGEERTIFSELHDHVNDVVFDKGIPQLDDMRMVDPRMQIDLPFQKKYLVFVDGTANINLDGKIGTTLMAKHLLV